MFLVFGFAVVLGLSVSYRGFLAFDDRLIEVNAFGNPIGDLVLALGHEGRVLDVETRGAERTPSLWRGQGMGCGGYRLNTTVKPDYCG